MAFVAMLAVAVVIPVGHRPRRSPVVIESSPPAVMVVPEASAGRVEMRPLHRASARRAIAVQELRAKSFPAPPMPLTEEERLLLSIAHKGDPAEMAMLEPETRAAEAAAETAAFQEFLNHPRRKNTTRQS